MKTKTMKSVTSGLPILSLSLLLIVSLSSDVSAKRGCSAFGHSCFGGHGKRSSPNEQARLEEVGTRAGSTNDVIANLDNDEIKQLRDFMKCRNCAVESPRRVNEEQTFIPLLVRKLLVSYRHPYSKDLASNNA